MVPRPTTRRERNNDYSAVGTAGRRTGVTLPQGRLDENGLEEITGLFTSPVKPSAVKQIPGTTGNDLQNSTFEASQDMSGMDSSGLTPTQALSARKSLGAPSLPPPRSASPRKTGIGGTPRRSNGIDISSPSKAVPPVDVEDHENSPSPTPIRVKPRRFLPSPEKRPLKEVVPNGEAVTSKRTEDVGKAFDQDITTDKGAGRGEREKPASQIREHESLGPDPGPTRKPNEYVEDDSFVQNPMGDDEIEEFLSSIDNTLQDAFPVPDFAPKVAKTVNDNVVESIVPAPPTDLHQKSTAPRKTARKRKSEEIEEQLMATSSKQPAKKPRATKAETSKAKGKQKAGPLFTQEYQTNPAAVQASAHPMPARLPGLIKDSNTHLSQRQQAELDQIIEKVKARPGKLKTLYVLKREKSKNPGADDIRSGRAIVKPLAYWSAEQCVYNSDAEAAGALEPGTRIPLSSVTEITHAKNKKTRKNDSADSDPDSDLEDHDEDPHADPWERSIGIFRGRTSIWPPPPHQTTLSPSSSSSSSSNNNNNTEETDLAYHPSSMLTREVAGSQGFRFAKLISTPFFGSGILELEPGAVKRPKNSRTMHMCFFVGGGRVTVRIGDGIGEDEGGGHGERFSVGRGSVFQVPRGNKYSIENEMEKPARIFFSQACETVPE